MPSLVPFTQLATDLNTANLPDYSFIVPNLCNDAHDCALSAADTWLQLKHQSVLRLMLEGLGVTTLPGEAATAPAMWEFFSAP